MTHVSYELGGRTKIEGAKGQIHIRFTPSNPIEGIRAFVRDEQAGDYVQVFEVGPTEWVDGTPQSWSRGNFETRETARHFASKAYRYINRRAH